MDAAKAKLKILLVEDSDIFINIVTEVLPEHDVIVCKNSKDGYIKYKEIKPDLVYIDLALPDGNGNDLLSKIMQLDNEAYVVIMTASRLKQDILESMQLGAQGYIVKPFSSDILKRSIDEYHEYMNS